MTPGRRTPGNRVGPCGPTTLITYNIRWAFIQTLLAVSITGVAAAQDPPPAVPPDTVAGIPLSVGEAVARALETHERARIARAAVDRTEGLVREAYANALPAIDGSYRYTRNLQRPVIFFNQGGETQQITIGDENEHAFGITVEQPIFDRSLGAAVRAAGHGRAAGEAAYERALSDVALLTRQAYYDALLARARTEARLNALRLAGARLEQVELFHEIGTAAEFDLLTARVGVENARPPLIRARNEHVLALNRVKRMSGLALDAGISLTDSLGYAPVEIGLEAAIARAAVERDDLAVQRELVAVAEQLVAVERSDGFPTLALELGVSRRASSADLVPEDRDFSQSASAALALRIPIFGGRRVEGRAIQAEATWAEERERLNGLERDVRLEVVDAWQSVQAAAEQVEAAEGALSLARRAYDIALVRFRNGLSTQLELNESEQDVFEADTNMAEALWSHMSAAAALAHAMGDR
ncbi:MAG TPA: TolC family protein [Gemmatimonadota bacterium]|nr:TolC family protein [Gemmatimonadota bacterium]